MTARIPNGAPVDVIPYDASVFTERQSNTAFTKGLLVSIDYIEPSEALVIAETPFKIIGAAFDGISEVVQLRINLTGKDKVLADANATLLASQVELIKAQAAHEEAQNPGDDEEEEESESAE